MSTAEQGLSLPPGFDTAKVAAWTEKIARPRLRTIVSRELESALGQAATVGAMSNLVD